MNTMEIKAEVKSLAPQIRAGRIEFKGAQRQGKWEEQARLRADGWQRSRRCRHLLVAYGLMRGLQYERIERPRQGNEPDWTAVEEIRNASAA